MNFYQKNLKSNNNTDQYVLSYLKLRLLIGVIGILLPFALPIGVALFDKQADVFQWSISHYYYSKMHILFTGLLCVLGSFLITYRGVYVLENWLSTIAGLLAISVSVFPTPVAGYLPCVYDVFFKLPELGDYVGHIHFASAVVMLLCFAIISGCYFTKHDDMQNAYLKKRRNNIYKACAVIIMVSLVLAGFFIWTETEIPFWPWLSHHSTYFFETTALVAFGFSWLVKGSFMWPHQGLLYKLLFRFWR